METTSKNKPIFSQRLAGYLMMRGFVVRDVAPDKKQTNRKVFFFTDTPELAEAIIDYKNP